MADVQTESDRMRRLAEASAWRVGLFDRDLETSAEFELWLSSDPDNLDAWRQVRDSWDEFSADMLEPELIIARRNALEWARRHRQRRSAQSNIGPSGYLWIAAGLIAAFFVGSVAFVWRNHPEVYQTALGERREITLADGSHVDLDSASLLTVQLGRRTRTLELLRGQASFEVEHDTRRPFTVTAAGRTVLATGTSFNVDLFRSDVIVTLIEGTVSILRYRPTVLPKTSPGSGNQVVARLSAGEQLILPDVAGEGSGRPPIKVLPTATLERTTAWETGQLIFDNEPLTSAAARVARYGDQAIRVEPAAAGLRLSGVFATGDITAFLDAVQRALPVTAETDADGLVHLRRNGS